jgi:[ribosomal protein S5]-alanine N-acetyltransferase
MLNTLFSPFPILRTAMLCLRNIQPADAQALYAMRTNPEVMRYIDREPAASVTEMEQLIERMLKDLEAGDAITWAISPAENVTAFWGTIGFWRMDKPHYRAEIGYMLFPEFQGRGIMTEAIYKVLDYGFNSIGLHSVEAHINPENQASAALLEKTGFVREAYFRENYFFRERFLDTAVYSLLKTDK